MHDCVIETRGLRKVFKGQSALNGLDLRVPRGSIFGFLGRNGAGKTTTIKLLMGLLRGDGGDAFLFGAPLGANGRMSRPAVESASSPRTRSSTRT